MLHSLRTSLTWLHTWSGLLLGSILFAVFWMGTLSVFDREIDRWMMPETRHVLPSHDISMDAISESVAAIVPVETSRWQFTMPSAREPIVRVYYQDEEEFHRIHLDPDTLKVVEGRDTLGATGFIFPFHYSLMLRWNMLGYWIVGLAAMAMLVLLVSGVIIHKKIFLDFFTFRSRNKLSRSSLDLHNLTGVLGLPFHFLITLSGLIIFISIYLPGVMDRTYRGDATEFSSEAFGNYIQVPAGEAGGELVSLDSLRQRAEAKWGGSKVYFTRIWNPNDANATVEMRRNREDAVPLNLDLIAFDGDSGNIYSIHKSGPVMTAQRWIAGFHFIQFDHWTLRWIYFVLGLFGCILIGSGFVIWIETRRKQHELEGKISSRIVEGLAVASITGVIIATLAFFVANRLLPAGAGLMHIGRAELEVWIFFIVWAGTAIHAGLRNKTNLLAWIEQCRGIVCLSLLAVILNWLTTGDHLLTSLSQGFWAIVGMDIMLLLGAMTSLFVTNKLSQGMTNRA